MEPWFRILVLSVGGALGVNARYWFGVWMSRWAGHAFPWATFTINVSGSFAIGYLTTLLAYRLPSPQVRLFLLVGFLGGYTTFSTFAFESLTLWEGGATARAWTYVIGSVVAGLAAVTLGTALARGLVLHVDSGPNASASAALTLPAPPQPSTGRSVTNGDRSGPSPTSSPGDEVKEEM